MSESTTETQTTTQNQSEINSQAPPPEASLSTTSPTTELSSIRFRFEEYFQIRTIKLIEIIKSQLQARKIRIDKNGSKTLSGITMISKPIHPLE